MKEMKFVCVGKGSLENPLNERWGRHLYYFNGDFLNPNGRGDLSHADYYVEASHYEKVIEEEKAAERAAFEKRSRKTFYGVREGDNIYIVFGEFINENTLHGDFARFDNDTLEVVRGTGGVFVNAEVREITPGTLFPECFI